MYIVEHELEDEVAGDVVQLPLLNAPPFPPSLHVMVPVGMDVVPVLVSVATAV